MEPSISYSNYIDTDFDQLLTMGQKLWNDFDKLELRRLINQAIQSSRFYIVMAKTGDQEAVGFTIISVRTDYVEGAVQSPTGYIEGIFVDPAYRKSGIARALIRLGENWCKTKGCVQMGSDTWIAATASRNFHRSIGFSEEDELVHFIKKI